MIRKVGTLSVEPVAKRFVPKEKLTEERITFLRDQILSKQMQGKGIRRNNESLNPANICNTLKKLVDSEGLRGCDDEPQLNSVNILKGFHNSIKMVPNQDYCDCMTYMKDLGLTVNSRTTAVALDSFFMRLHSLRLNQVAGITRTLFEVMPLAQTDPTVLLALKKKFQNSIPLLKELSMSELVETLHYVSFGEAAAEFDALREALDARIPDTNKEELLRIIDLLGRMNSPAFQPLEDKIYARIEEIMHSLSDEETVVLAKNVSCLPLKKDILLKVLDKVQANVNKMPASLIAQVMLIDCQDTDSLFHTCCELIADRIDTLPPQLVVELVYAHARRNLTSSKLLYDLQKRLIPKVKLLSGASLSMLALALAKGTQGSPDILEAIESAAEGVIGITGDQIADIAFSLAIVGRPPLRLLENFHIERHSSSFSSSSLHLLLWAMGVAKLKCWLSWALILGRISKEIPVPTDQQSIMINECILVANTLGFVVPVEQYIG